MCPGHSTFTVYKKLTVDQFEGKTGKLASQNIVSFCAKHDPPSYTET